MIVSVNGKTYRLFFATEDVLREDRYHGHKKAKFVIKAKPEDPPMIRRTACSLQIASGKDEAGKTVWSEIATAAVYQNHADAPRRRQGSLRAFSAVMHKLTEMSISETGVTKQDRALIAKEFLATRPRRKNIASFRRENAKLRAQVAVLTQELLNLGHSETLIADTLSQA